MSAPESKADESSANAMYADLLRRFGDTPAALNWGSRESQWARFDALGRLGNFDGASLLDIGCGLGDFQRWLQEHGQNPQYLGIDVSPEMIARARALHPAARFEICAAGAAEYPVPGAFDYVVASGIFYLQPRDPERFFRQCIGRMFAACRRGIAFNSLSSWADKSEPGEFRADPVATLAFCREITPWVSLRHDYHPGDFTVYLHRARQRP